MFTSRRSLLALAALAALMLAAAACSPSRVADVAPTDHARYAAARARWQESGVRAYSWIYQRGGCECLPEWTRPLRVDVSAGGAITVTDAATGQAPQHFGDFEAPTVEHVFAVIADALARDAYRLHAEFDPVYGYPTRVEVDYDRDVADDEFRIETREFVRK